MFVSLLNIGKNYELINKIDFQTQNPELIYTFLRVFMYYKHIYNKYI